MCGRYALGIRAAFVRYQLQQMNMPVDEAPGDDEVRESYNFAPGYYGMVYRLDSPGPEEQDAGDQPPNMEEGCAEDASGHHDTLHHHEAKTHKLQAMKWGLIPFWTKRNPDYGTLMRTINCRDDSLEENKGMWTSMKKKKRCLVIAQGFYEWLKKNDGKEKLPHFVKRKDGQLMLLAGLWDRVRYDGAEEDIWSYTIITTEVNKQLSFLHDRMPVILEPGSEEMWRWLDPDRTEWSRDLQSLLEPYSGELECYAVSKDVGKVGNNSPDFIVPVASTANKQNIKNFFNAQKGAKTANAPSKDHSTSGVSKSPQKDVSATEGPKSPKEDQKDLSIKAEDHEETKEDNAPVEGKVTLKRSAETIEPTSPPPKKSLKSDASPAKSAVSPLLRKKARDATSNGPRQKVSPVKPDATKSKKITSFFGHT